MSIVADPADAGLSQGEDDGQASAGDAPGDATSWILLASIIGLPGIFGGLLYGMRGQSLSLPHRKQSHRWEPGVLGDCLYGLAGGLVIFLVVPGEFALTAIPSLQLIKLIAIAIVGGYGGRSLVEKVLSQQVRDLTERVEEAEAQTAIDEKAVQLTNQHLDDDVEVSQVDENELRAAVAAASLTAREKIFYTVRLFRKNAFPNRRDLLPRAIPVIEGLIKADRDGKYHRNHGQLGYALKDKEPADPQAALEQFTRAIEIRDRLGIQGYGIYEYSRAQCRIRLGGERQEILEDLERAAQSPVASKRLREQDAWNQDVFQWLDQNKTEIADGLSRHRISV